MNPSLWFPHRHPATVGLRAGPSSRRILARLGGLLLSAMGLGVGAADFTDPGADRDALPTVPPGFEVSFFAREPLVRQPCSLAFDARGRLCVGMGPQYRNPKPETPGDSVVLVLDTDGDGRADATRVFATGFNAIQGLAWHGRDLWVANSPDLTVVRDLDGDDTADEYVRVYTDLGNLEHGLHGLNWAPDGRLYMSKGNSKGLTQPGRVAPAPFRDLWGVKAPPGTPDFPPPVTFRKGDYRKAYHDPEDDWGREGGILRCDDGGGNLEIVARGFRNPWDITFDTGFNWLGTDNDQTTGDRVFMPFFGAHFGWNHPWSAHWSTELHEPSAPVSGPLFEGSGTGVLYGQSPLLPPRYRDVFFVNDWLRKTTFVWRPRWDGALLRPEGGDWEPFVTGGNALFRPTDLEWGPDGALWILGWSSGYGAEYRDGQMTSEGRVYRVTVKDTPTIRWRTAKRSKALAQWSVAELVEDLAGTVAVWRVDAQDELVRRGASVRETLMQSLVAGAGDPGRETWMAWSLGRMEPADSTIDDWMVARLKDSAASRNLQVQAIRILGFRSRRRGDGTLPGAVLDGLRSPETRIRFESVEAIGQARPKSAVPALVELLGTESDPATFYAAWQTWRRLDAAAGLRARLTDARGGVRRAALLALLEDHALQAADVRPLAGDPDRAVAAVARLWLEKAAGGGETVVVRGRPLSSGGAGAAAAERPADPSAAGAGFGSADGAGRIELVPPTVPTTLDAALSRLGNGNPRRGRQLFHSETGAGCFRCHRLEDHGNGFGPDLASLGDRATARHVAQSILEPNAVITEGFHLQTVETADAEYSGILLEESGLRVVLGLATGEQAVIPKSKVVSRRSHPQSAMPAYDVSLTPEAVADLAQYLLGLRRGGAPGAGPAGLQVNAAADRLAITSGDRPVAEFVFRDARIFRPFFSNVQAPDGTRVTRNHPPVAGVDAVDHDTMHPGIWLGLGDVSGEDFWRNKGRMEHREFCAAPAVRDGVVRFGQVCALRAADGRELGIVTNWISISEGPGGRSWLFTWDADFAAGAAGLAFGDQEEMGFGARVATALTEKNGGVIRSGAGLVSAAKTWGQPAPWCDYSGVVNGVAAGIQLMAHPSNFRECWWHNRDYGVFVANPFGREAMKQGAKSVVRVEPGQVLRLQFGAAAHGGPGFDPAAAYDAYLQRAR